MNFTIDYKISEKWNNWSLDWSKETDEMELRYSKVLGNIYIATDSINFNAEWEWIPLLDFISCVRYISRSLENESVTIKYFEFTESDAYLKFQKKNKDIAIEASYASGIILVEADKFNIEVINFSKKLFNEIIKLKPNLERNIYFEKLMDSR